MVASPDNFPLLKDLLADQQRLQTPAARAAEAFDKSPWDERRTKLYTDLIPLSAPRPGEQYAFEVALDSCTGCKACVSACHALNGLDDTETWRDVGMIVGGDERHPIQQTVTTACHHCADPACLNGCPVLAYEKDPVTGIVRHLDDQCIGCQYCVLKCPYDVPKYNARLGIVRKCDMCHSRLAEGEAPACVQACPTHAIRIVTVSHDNSLGSHVTTATQASGSPVSTITSAFLAAAPDPAYTQPTTRYVSRKPISLNLTASDAGVLRPQPTHWPLVVMLTLLPMAVGSQLFATIGRAGSNELASFMARFWPTVLPAPTSSYLLALAGWLAGAVGLGASVFHLGQPLRAWRIFLGWRKSWLSREAMVFGPWFGVSTASLLVPQLIPVAVALGGCGLLCSVMIYVDTRRRLWRLAQTAPRFFGTAVILGAATAFALGHEKIWSAIVLALATAVKLGLEARVLLPLNTADEETPPTAELNSAKLLAGPLRSLSGLRIAIGAVAGLLGPVLVIAGQIPPAGAWVVWCSVFVAELLERALFFRAVDAPKMPGLPGSPSKRR